MKKYITLIVLLFLIQVISLAQSTGLVRLWHELDTVNQDTSRVKIMVRLCTHYQFNKPDSALYYGNSAVVLARKINFPRGETQAMSHMSVAQQSIGNYANALKISLQAMKIAEENQLAGDKAATLLTIGTTYKLSENYDQALKFLKESKMLSDSVHKDDLSIISQAYI